MLIKTCVKQVFFLCRCKKRAEPGYFAKDLIYVRFLGEESLSYALKFLGKDLEVNTC